MRLNNQRGGDTVFQFLIGRDHSEHIKIFSNNQQDMMLFFKQHNIDINQVEVDYIPDENFNIKVDDDNILASYQFKSNQSNETFNIMTTERLISYALQLVGDHLSDACIFGSAIFRDDIEFIKVIQNLLGEIPHVQILDYGLLDDLNLTADTNWMYIKKDKLFDPDVEPDWVTNGVDAQDIYESLFDSCISDTAVQPITVEAYVRGFAEMVMNIKNYN